MTDGSASPVPDRPEPRRQVGHYRIDEELGAGSFSRVFLARDLRSGQRVALKLLSIEQVGAALRDRFEIERRALAQMNSDYVARLYDSGVVDGQYYFAIEYVDGLPLTTFCDRHELAIGARVELFAKVCRGVGHIHRHAVIHRDIKPGNVLVTEIDGRFVPKIIDLGLARGIDRLLHAEHIPTAPGVVLGTLGFMAPEQAGGGRGHRGTLDARADVYSLGALLYVLLAGDLPIGEAELRGLGLAEQLQRLLRADPKPPSRKVRELHDAEPSRAAAIARARGVEAPDLIGVLFGDLDWIVMKAMEREPRRRYDSVAAFERDLADYLALRPVSARPPSRRYAFRKFLRRNRVAVGIVALTMLALVAVTTLAIRGWYQAVENARLDAANLQLALAEAATARTNERLARERAEEEIRRQEAVAGNIAARARAAVERGDYESALAVYDEAIGNVAVDQRQLTIDRIRALDGARRYAEAADLLAGLPGIENDAQLQVLLADLGADRLRNPLVNLAAAERALELDRTSGELAPADRLYVRALLTDDPLEVLHLLTEARGHDPYHRRVNDCLGASLLLTGRFEEAFRFRETLEALYPDDPQTWFFSLSIASIRGEEAAADALLARIEDRFSERDLRLAEMIRGACALVPFLNRMMRDNLEDPGRVSVGTVWRIVSTIVPLKRAIDDMMPEPGEAADIPAGVTFLRTPPAIVGIYRPLWDALRGQPGGNLLDNMKLAFEAVMARSVEGSLPAIYAMAAAIDGDREGCMGALRKSLTLPSGVLERRTILLQDLLVAAALLSDKEFVGEPRERFAADVRGWVAEACELANKTAGECNVIYHAAYRVESDRLAELIACWRRLAPEAASPRLADAELHYYRRDHELALRIVETVEPGKLEDWQRSWAERLREGIQRARAGAAPTVERQPEDRDAAEATSGKSSAGRSSSGK
ncbi:MAG: protein kinase [Planctomycetes bacterium]|nr:protein kinase [Planctomycetota bacterium]